MKLYEITGALRQLEEMDEDQKPEMLEAYLNEIQGELQAKCTSIIMLVENLESTKDAIKKAEERMAERRKSLENRIKHIKSYVLRNMQAASITKVECPEFVLSIRNNPPSVSISEDAVIPLSYMRQPPIPDPEPDKRLLMEDLKQGVIVDGVQIVQTQSLVIK